MNLETKITMYKFTPQLFTLTLDFIVLLLEVTDCISLQWLKSDY